MPFSPLVTLLKGLPPELAHDWAVAAMRHQLFASGPVVKNPVSLFGHTLWNPIGLAAGFDKNADLVDVVHSYGFSFLEVGSITYGGGPGNPKPRLFRLGPSQLLNRMGLNGLPALAVARRLERAKSSTYGVSIARTNCPVLTGTLAIEDIRQAYDCLKDFGMYTVINISCPNSKEGRTFEEDPPAFRQLLSALRSVRSFRPLLIKLSSRWLGSEERLEQLTQLVQVCEQFGVEGFVMSNTIPFEDPRFGKGGLSGVLLRGRTLAMVNLVRTLAPLATIIGVGGVTVPADVPALLSAGANLLQVYTGFVHGPFQGPSFVRKLLAEF